MKVSPARRNDALMVALAVVVILADQLAKGWIVQYFREPGLKVIPLLGQVLQLEYVQNTGVAFSLLRGQTVLFLFIAVAIVVIGSLYWRMRDTGSLAIKLTFGLILGGALGNLIDRFHQAYVVDFIHFQIPSRFDFAVFNVADSAISLGVVFLAYLLWRGTPAQASAADQPAAGKATTQTQPQADGRASASKTAGRPGPMPLGEGPVSPPATAPRIRNPRARAK